MPYRGFGALGRYLMDHAFGALAFAEMPALDARRFGQDGRANGIYIPRFRNLDKPESAFLRGYGFQGESPQSLYGHAYGTPGFGADFKRSVRDRPPWSYFLLAYAECLARPANRVRINKHVVDAWGIPALHVEMAFGDNERKLLADASEQAGAMLGAAGAKNINVNREMLSTPGLCIHEVGTARMGDDPKTSVLNRFNQAHDVANLFVTDGACFVSNACQNPTLTMMAITARACDYAIGELRAGRL